MSLKLSLINLALAAIAVNAPISVQAAGVNVDLVSGQFMMNIETLCDQMIKFKDERNAMKMLDTIISIKHEIEWYTGKEVDIAGFTKSFQHELKDLEIKIDKNELKNLVKIIKDKDNLKTNKHAVEFTPTFQITVGVTLTLCGYCLYSLPNPVSKAFGQKIVETGATITFEKQPVSM